MKLKRLQAPTRFFASFFFFFASVRAVGEAEATEAKGGDALSASLHRRRRSAEATDSRHLRLTRDARKRFFFAVFVNLR
jgi:hypothetical protein